MAHYNYLHKGRALRDALILIAFNAVMFLVFSNYDTLEWAYQLSRDYEALELDEILPLGLSLSLTLLLFTYRRMIELGEMTKAFEELSMRDPVTSLPNRRAGYLAIISHRRESAQSNRAFSLLKLDIDGIEKINNHYGASIGDEAVISIVKNLGLSLPDQGKLIRWSDTMFLMLIPQHEKTPLEIANSIRLTLIEKVTELPERITFNMGLTTWRPKDSIDDMLENVEDALISAKLSGENTVSAG